MQDVKKRRKIWPGPPALGGCVWRKNFKSLRFKILSDAVIGSLFHGPKRQFGVEVLCFLWSLSQAKKHKLQLGEHCSSALLSVLQKRRTPCWLFRVKKWESWETQPSWSPPLRAHLSANPRSLLKKFWSSLWLPKNFNRLGRNSLPFRRPGSLAFLCRGPLKYFIFSYCFRWFILRWSKVNWSVILQIACVPFWRPCETLRSFLSKSVFLQFDHFNVYLELLQWMILVIFFVLCQFL